MRYPKAYYQIRKIKKFWEKSSAPNKAEIIAEFDQALLDIRIQYESEVTLLEAWEYAKSTEL